MFTGVSGNQLPAGVFGDYAVNWPDSSSVGDKALTSVFSCSGSSERKFHLIQRSNPGFDHRHKRWEMLPIQLIEKIRMLHAGLGHSRYFCRRSVSSAPLEMFRRFGHAACCPCVS